MKGKRNAGVLIVCALIMEVYWILWLDRNRRHFEDICGKGSYVNVCDVDGRVRRYHTMKTRRGITKCIDLKSFHDPMKGYLINDTCVFGAEVFVVKCVSKGECLSMIKEPARCYHLWKIVKFSNLLDETYRSKPFGDYNWKILLYPNGFRHAKGNSISIFLSPANPSIPNDTTKLLAKCIVRVKDQIKGRHIELE
ncbi:hypothetical protein Patl1_27036 [Pistacia atlantica]|uniref:Uncharacterized protein n=1 Tax=Pistacia atlantica TaxID=434234 RepID=A0ACC1AZI9_9ROSI|nr:hypothetical protein Patl1_27036 [Pistacia atlantica]